MSTIGTYKYRQKCYHVSPATGPKLEANKVAERRYTDVTSLKLMIATLDDVFKLLDSKGLGININGEYITHLRFADDIIIMADTLEDLDSILDDLSRVSGQAGFKMYKDKTKLSMSYLG